MSETEIWDADVRTPGDLKKVEDELYADAMAKALKVFEQKLQRMADALGECHHQHARQPQQPHAQDA